MTIVDLRIILDSSSKNSNKDNRVIAEKMLQLIGKIIALLEHNESCRWSWSDGNGNRLDRGSKINTAKMIASKRELVNLIEECRKKVKSKSDLYQFITIRHK